MQLETRRLILREIQEADFPAMRAIDSDPEVLRFRSRQTITPQMTAHFIEQARLSASEDPRQRYALAIARNDDQQVVAQIGLEIDSRLERQAWIWFSTLRRFWGQGYMTEAAREILSFGFENLNLHRIFATCHPENQASRRVLEKLGMRQEAWLRQERWVNGAWWDTLLYALLESEWFSQPR